MCRESQKSMNVELRSADLEDRAHSGQDTVLPPFCLWTKFLSGESLTHTFIVCSLCHPSLPQISKCVSCLVRLTLAGTTLLESPATEILCFWFRGSEVLVLHCDVIQLLERVELFLPCGQRVPKMRWQWENMSRMILGHFMKATVTRDRAE